LLKSYLNPVNLIVEAKIKPADIAFLRPGQKATIKFTAYDYTIYGSLKAELESVGADVSPMIRETAFLLSD